MSFPFLPGTVPDASDLAEGPASYVPSLTAATTNPNLGANGEATGWYYRSGLYVVGAARVRGNGTGVNVGSGVLFLSLPLPRDDGLMGGAGGSAALVLPMGVGFHRHGTAGSNFLLMVQPSNTSTSEVSLNFAGNNGRLTATSLDSSDFRISISFRYPVPFGV